MEWVAIIYFGIGAILAGYMFWCVASKEGRKLLEELMPEVTLVTKEQLSFIVTMTMVILLFLWPVLLFKFEEN